MILENANKNRFAPYVKPRDEPDLFSESHVKLESRMRGAGLNRSRRRMDSGGRYSNSAGSPKRASSRQLTRNERARVVIADDDAIVLDHIDSLLQPRFDVVGLARNGRELYNVVRELSPSVVVTDISMPEMTGIEACRLITKDCPRVKVVVVSIHDDPLIIEAAFLAGASGYVWKPSVFTELIPAIEDVLAGRLYRSTQIKL